MTITTDAQIPAPGLLLGWSKPVSGEPMGFRTSREAGLQSGEAPVSYDGEGHLLTIAPTGAGKGVGCVVPAILRHGGPVIVMDLKGENYAITRRHRAQMGSRVSCIDPFGIAARILADRPETTPGEIAGFNPFDLLPYLSDDRDTACRALAEMLVNPHGHSADPFWRDAAVGVIAALIDCYDGFKGPMRSLSAIVNDLSIEVPDAPSPGDFHGEYAALSALSADVTLLEQMEAVGLTPHAAWAAFDASGEASAVDLAPHEIQALLRKAAFTALTEQGKDASHQDNKALAEDIAQRFTGPEARFTRFTANLQVPETVPGSAHDLFRRIWIAIRKANLSATKPAPAGSLAHTDNDEPPENYPLALHRMARHPSLLCRSVAAQPMTTDKTWGSVLLTVRAELAQFSGRSIAKTLGGQGAIDLEAIRRGDDISLYIAFPPSRIRSHASLFRVIVEGLLSVITSRTERPSRRTLLLLDEIAQLGRIDLLVTAKTLLRGYGVQVWSFWQDISQLRTNYPKDWETVMNNCRVVQVFGRGMGVMVAELSRALDTSPEMISSLAAADCLTWIDSSTPKVLRRPVCHADEGLRELCDEGPFARPSIRQAAPAPVQSQASSEDEFDLEEADEDDLLDEEDFEGSLSGESLLEPGRMAALKALIDRDGLAVPPEGDLDEDEFLP